jgi:hypothetical protein
VDLILESFGKLFTESGEIVAEGSCQVDFERGIVTLRPLVDTPLITRQRGQTHLVLDDGTTLTIREGIIQFRLNVPGTPPGPAYRLFVAGGGNGSPRLNEGVDAR